ncbi:MAG: DUF1214 domain-containing protein [Burkholderiaceae bacterium]
MLYTTGWIHLGDGPRVLHVPSSARHGGRYFVLALYDAWTNNFANPGLRTSDPAGETVVLTGPGTARDVRLPTGARVIPCPTDLVWLIARVVVGTGDDIEPARALQSDIRLDCPPDTDTGRLPPGVADWVGAPQDTMAALQERPADAQAIAGAFFTNLCRALAGTEVPQPDQGMLSWFARGKLVPGTAFDWAWLDAPLRDGLTRGLSDAAALLEANSRSRAARPWVASFSLGKYGTQYITRALTAYKGLGGLVSDEAVYAMSDFDADRQPLDGQNSYLMHFEAGNLPPVDAFGSVTLDDADRFLYPNALARHAIGDRTPGLQTNPDGSLTLRIGHTPPDDTANWLPAPSGRFYLILRLYCPRPETRSWPIPPLHRIAG